MKEKVSHPQLEEAKRRFPVGTKFYPAHIKNGKDNPCTVTSGDVFHDDADQIILSMGNKTKNGHDYIELIYDHTHGWADIISTPEPVNKIINNYPIY